MTTTTELSVTSTVGQIVAERPQSSRVFEQLGIDYCCGGQRTLQEACEQKDLDARTVLAVLLSEPLAAAGEAQANWHGASLADLTDHIEKTHHAYLREQLPRLGMMTHKVAGVHGERYPWTIQIDSTFSEFATAMQSHMLKEEQVLFPLIRDLETGRTSLPAGATIDIRDPLTVLEREHADAGESLERMRQLSNGFTPPDHACATFLAMLDGLARLEIDTHQHVHKENSILFPKARDLAQQHAG